jgi:DNA-binding transcriptional ArsR family regulator
MYTFEIKLARKLGEKVDELVSRESIKSIASLPVFSIFKIPSDGIRLSEPEFDGSVWVHRGSITFQTDQTDRDGSYAYEMKRIRDRLDESIRRTRPGDAPWFVDDRSQNDDESTGASNRVMKQPIDVETTSKDSATVVAAIEVPAVQTVKSVEPISQSDSSWNAVAGTIAAAEAETSDYPQTNALASDSTIEPPTREMHVEPEPAAVSTAIVYDSHRVPDAPSPPPSVISLEHARTRADETATKFQTEPRDLPRIEQEEPRRVDPAENVAEKVAWYRSDETNKIVESNDDLETESEDNESSADLEESAAASTGRRPRSSTNSIDKSLRRAVRDFKIAADPIRLKTMMLLSEGERNVTRLCSDLGDFTQPAVSHHLALMRNADLVESRRDGKNIIYSLTDQGRVLVDVVKTYYKHE